MKKKKTVRKRKKTRKSINKHEKEYVHIHKSILLIFFPIYFPIFFISTIGLIVLDTIIKVTSLTLVTIIGFFDKDLFCLTYDPDYDRVIKDLEILQWLTNDKGDKK